MELTFGIISACVGITGTIFGIVTLFRNKKTDDKLEGEQGGVLHTDIGYIKKGIDGIERRLEKQESQYVDIIRSIAEVKAYTKEAHNRIDRLEQYHTPN